MRIAIIGAGKVGTALGRGWGAVGHTIIFGVRHLGHSHMQTTVAEAGVDVHATTNAEAAKVAEVIVLCTPWAETHAAITELGDIAGKILIDCTNPLLPGFAGLALGTTTSAGEQVATWAKGARVVKSLNTTGSANMRDPAYPSGPLAMLLCGDDTEAKATVTALVRDLGFVPVDAGPLLAARYLEGLAMLWIHLAFKEGHGQNFALTLVQRDPATAKLRSA